MRRHGGNPRGGGAPVAASRLGLSTEEYERRRAEGHRWCWGCGAWHELSAFGRDRSRPDGIARACRAFHADRAWAADHPRSDP